MRLPVAALAVCVGVLVAGSPARAAELLTQEDAFARVASTHPTLRLLGARRDVLVAEREGASQRPPLQLGFEVENVLGTGAAGGVAQAEFTLSLASVLERGGKLDARRTLVQSRIDALAIDNEIRRLDLLAEVARRYVLGVASQHEVDIAGRAIAQRQRTVTDARKRFHAGASPESGVFSAQAALARVELDRARAQARASAQRQHLAALWGERGPDFQLASSDLFALPPMVEFAALAEWLSRTPELARFADEARIGEARLRLAGTQATADLDWQFGVRRFQDGNDVALVGSVSLPLGASARAQPGLRAARAELAGLEIEREAAGLALYSTLAEAHGRYQVARIEVTRLQDDVLPRLSQAEQATGHAYRAGAASYLEWASVQAEHTAVRQQRVEAALRGQLALIEIQRLTGQPLLAKPESGATGVER